MKPSPFEYVAPVNLSEALDALAWDPDESKVLAGGQSLVPMMNLRLARPARLIDINRIPGLERVCSDGRRLRIAARTRHAQLETTDHEGALGHLLRSAAAKIGHLPIRTRGTFGGSIAHCDAASEWCVVASLLDAEMTLESAARGRRTVTTDAFFKGRFTTATADDEILTEVSLPLLGNDWLAGIAEFSRRTGDFGIVIAAAAVCIADGVVTEARVSLGGVAEIPVRCPDAETAMVGEVWAPAVALVAAQVAASEVDPPSDTNGDSAFRRDLVRALVPRSLAQPDRP